MKNLCFALIVNLKIITIQQRQKLKHPDEFCLPYYQKLDKNLLPIPDRKAIAPSIEAIWYLCKGRVFFANKLGYLYLIT
ncbi:hypothetical protein [Okeania sp. KiyG1]|uniref:hypothetical protein n=1 Tax=Okeania sp. KiyG1 TaxID=2720165 RepID=UPI001920A231|nr:hypothetical protein [Okeania sp. KiyG1]